MSTATVLAPRRCLRCIGPRATPAAQRGPRTPRSPPAARACSPGTSRRPRAPPPAVGAAGAPSADRPRGACASRARPSRCFAAPESPVCCPAAPRFPIRLPSGSISPTGGPARPSPSPQTRSAPACAARHDRASASSVSDGVTDLYRTPVESSLPRAPTSGSSSLPRAPTSSAPRCSFDRNCRALEAGRPPLPPSPAPIKPRSLSGRIGYGSSGIESAAPPPPAALAPADGGCTSAPACRKQGQSLPPCRSLRAALLDPS